MGKCDKYILFITFLLILIGALMIYSTTSVVTPLLKEKGITEFYYLKRHLFTITVSFIFLLVGYFVKPETLRKSSILLLFSSLVLLILVFVPGLGVTYNGATRWIKLWPSTLQPSEFVKLSMVIFLAYYISRPNYRADNFLHFVIPVAIMSIFALIIIKQPDFGAAMSLVFLTLIILFLSGTKVKYITSLLLFIIPVVIKLVKEPYRLKRIYAYLNPWEDSLGSGFHLIQSFLAFGRGGITGVGLGNSRQKLAYLPESHTDFIFSIIGEEFGLIGVTLILGLFIFLFIRCISVANNSKNDLFVYYLTIGLSLMITMQALINFAVTTGLVPTKGLPLPFISYGGSSLLVNMVAIGMILRISKCKNVKQVQMNNYQLLKGRGQRTYVY